MPKKTARYFRDYSWEGPFKEVSSSLWSGPLKSLMVKAEALNRLKLVLSQTLAPAQRSALKSVDLREGTLIVVAATQAAVMRLTLSNATLKSTAEALGLEVNDVLVRLPRVEGRWVQPQTANPTLKRRKRAPNS